MKLTSQQEFGLRCLLRLAREECDTVDRKSVNTLPVNKIADDEGLSTEYAGKLMGVLARGGLVESVRGRNGGFRLARPAEEISLAESMACLGGKLFDDDTCDRFRGDRHHCIHAGACTIRSVWTGLQFVLDQILTRTSLRDMVEHSEEGMDEWVQRHVSALVDSASDAERVVSARSRVPDHSDAIGAEGPLGPPASSPGRQPRSHTEGIGNEERDPVELTVHGHEAGNS